MTNQAPHSTASSDSVAWRVAFPLAWTLALMIATVTGPAQAQTFSVLHVFTGRDGANPSAALTVDGAGNLYGTTQSGGNLGNAFKLAHKASGWILTPLYVFTGGADGDDPESGLVIGPNGAFYGTTYGGGLTPDGFGTVFELTPPPTVCKAVLCYWNESVLYAFMGAPDAGLPQSANLTFDAGSIYGTTPQGGAGGTGGLFELTPSGGGWTERVIHSFTNGSDGSYPYGGVILDSAGNVYGTTSVGGNGADCRGVNFCGTVYELMPSGGSWTESILFNFAQDGTTGAAPQSTLIMDGSGNLYGTTSFYGPNGGGTVFELTPSNGTWVFSLIASFNCFIPAGVVMDGGGNLYGVCAHGGAFGDGWVFELTNTNGTWASNDLHDFIGTDGAEPNAPVALDASGNLYGTTVFGGDLSDCQDMGCGVVWEIMP